jgi:hypothetical protein
VWTSIFEPLPTFLFLQRLGKESVWGSRHDLPYHVVGSAATGGVSRARNVHFSVTNPISSRNLLNCLVFVEIGFRERKPSKTISDRLESPLIPGRAAPCRV